MNHESNFTLQNYPYWIESCYLKINPMECIGYCNNTLYHSD